MSAPKRYAAWDRNPLRAGSILSVEVAEPTDVRELRCWARTRLFDDAAAAAREGRLTATLAQQVRNDYLQRQAIIADPEPAPPPFSPQAHRKLLFWLASSFGFLLALIFVMTYLSQGSWIDAARSSIGIALLAVGVLLGVNRNSSPNRESSRPSASPDRIRLRRCCDCGYNLNGSPPGLPAERIGIDVGPRCCPECAAPWPLVPPSDQPTLGVYPGPPPS